ncbi:MAG: hypothetical protein SH859_13710 [Hyphomicrobium aestuarii]|nr:hypothetical protein [Hyphomicrobium aestuarii]
MMLDDAFTPKPGRMRGEKPAVAPRYVARVLAEAGRGGRLGRRGNPGKGSFGLGRGASALARFDAPIKNSRRVIVKARICRHRGGTLNAAATMLAIDREVEQRKISNATIELRPRPDGSDVSRLKGRLGANWFSFVLSACCTSSVQAVTGTHGFSLFQG